jgi:rhodanese-related sulfurtransferase/DNA-directed RNA polymerase subunit RPC12/RpoP
MLTRLFLLNCFLFLFISAYSQVVQQHSAKKPDNYQCSPCGQDCDTATYDEPGKCPHCQMSLVKKSGVSFRTIEPEAVCSYIQKHPDVILLDVRTKEEFDGKANPNFGALRNAINIPILELESRLLSINHLKNKEIIVYCSHSHRSPRASYLLTQNGFNYITNMAGGMSVMKDNACKR